MPTSAFGFSILMLFAGCGIPIMAALNASVGERFGSAAFAAIILALVALVCLSAWFFIENPDLNLEVRNLQPVYLLAGAFFAFYIVSITVSAPRIGIGNAVFLVLLGQIFTALLIDQFGLFGAPVIKLSPERVIGVLMMIAGIALTRKVDFSL